ncbi:MAG: family 43 glycosylhydrolase [Bacteroidales bacterium]|nr:family 43 glycosylhydrolase [Bacteroidales bacterium]
MKLRLLSLAALAACLCSSCNKEEHTYGPSKPTQPDETEEEVKTASATKGGTLLRTSSADPSMVCQDGVFYLTMTGSANIALVYDKDLAKLTTSDYPSSSHLVYQSKDDPTVTDIFGTGATINGTWSPELHYFTEEECPGNAGWYMVFALRKSGTDNSAYVRPVVLKSTGKTPAGPWGHPVSGQASRTQRFLDANGDPFTEWAIGVSYLRIPTGQYKGIYALWVDEVGRGTGLGNFYQRLRIARLSKPWQIASEAATITTPTQAWEQKGASSTLPMVVEGGTAVYGKDGEIFLAYCGSGYWSDYGLGQLTLKREGGDYANPLLSSSWVKYAKNPVFSSASSADLRGAGHAFFFKDVAGKDLMCYHAYPYVNGVKQNSRNAYVEPYTIDYDAKSETAPDGVLKFGLLGTGVTAPVGSSFEYTKRTN